MSDLEVLLPHVKKGMHPMHLTSDDIFTEKGSQTRNWTRRINSDYSQN